MRASGSFLVGRLDPPSWHRRTHAVQNIESNLSLEKPTPNGAFWHQKRSFVLHGFRHTRPHSSRDLLCRGIHFDDVAVGIERIELKEACDARTVDDEPLRVVFGNVLTEACYD